jgi:HEAT repeat protein
VQRATTLAEISQLASAPDRQYAAQRLAELLGAPDAAVRTRSAWALGRVGGPRAATALAAAARDQAPEVRVQAVGALTAVEATRAIPTLGDLLLRDPDVRVRRAAARALGTLPDPAATSALSAATQDGDMLVRRDVANALRRRGVPVSP